MGSFMTLSSILILFSCSQNTTDSAAKANKISSTTVPESWSHQELTRMEQQVQNSDALQKINDVEDAVANIDSDILSKWEKAWQDGDNSFYSKMLKEGTGLDWNTTCEKTREMGGIVEYRWNPKSTTTDTADKYIASFKSIDSVQFDVIDARITEQGVRVEMRYQLRGVFGLETTEQRQHDRGTLEITFSSIENNTGEEWKIVSIDNASFERIRSTRSPIFQDVTTQWKLDQVKIDDRKEAIRRGGYALVAADYNNDGKSDILVGHHGAVQLFKNTGTSFVDVTKEEGLEGEKVVKSAAIVDMDGDGDKDILALRFVDVQQNKVRDFVAYENMGDGANPRFVARHNVLPRSIEYDRAMPLTLADFNNDGTLDIYIGFPGIRDFTSGISNRERTNGQASQGMWLNKGDWKFEEKKDGVVQDNSVYAHAAMASDLDGDGQVELLVVDDSGRINPLYKQNENGDYVNVAKTVGLSNAGYSMGITTGDFNADGLIDIMSTNITLNAGQRLLRIAEDVNFKDVRYKENFSNIQEGYNALMLYKNNGDGTFSQVKDNDLNMWSGDAVASGEWIDYNHDGLLDYYTPNGLWSSGEENLDSLFFRADITTFTDPLYTGIKTEKQLAEELGAYMMANDVHGGSNYVASSDNPSSDNPSSDNPSSDNPSSDNPSSQEVANPILRLLRKHRNDSDELTYSLGGYQHNSLFRNNGDGTFTEVGYLENADRIEDGYIVAAIDIDRDGRQDLVMRNTDPALEHSYAPVVLLRNTQENAKSACVSFDTNKNPIGVKVFAEVNGTKLVREIRSVNGAVQSEPMAVFGLGKAEQADNVEVHWPDGTIDQLGSISSCYK
jgi:hypothetical protein